MRKRPVAQRGKRDSDRYLSLIGPIGRIRPIGPMRTSTPQSAIALPPIGPQFRGAGDNLSGQSLCFSHLGEQFGANRFDVG
jgi:hypothetical protein